MSEIRFLTSSDEHLSDQNPSSYRKDNYRDAILEKLAWQGELAKRFSATSVLRGGDYWHVKAANKTTMASLVKSIDIHKQYVCPTYAIVGNHDLSNNDIETIDRQPAGVLFKSEIFSQLDERVFTSRSLSVRVIKVSYTTDLSEGGLQDKVKKCSNHTYTIAVVHALASMSPSEKIQSYFGERILDYRDLVFDGCPDVYVFGHYHKDQGIVDHCGVKFVNLGAISRGSLTFENLERKPKVSLIKLNSQGISIEEHVVPHRDASEVFDTEKKEKIDNARRGIDEFIVKLKANTDMSSNNHVQDRINNFQNSDFPSDLKKKMLEVMHAAESGVVDE